MRFSFVLHNHLQITALAASDDFLLLIGIHGAEQEKEDAITGTVDHPEPITTSSSHAFKGKATKERRQQKQKIRLKREGKNKK